MMYYGGNHPIGWGWMVFWMILTTLLWVALIWGIVRAAMNLGAKNQRPTESKDRDPLTVLQHRYAAGEIDEEEFQRRRQTLLNSH